MSEILWKPKVKSGGQKKKERKEEIQRIKETTKYIGSYFKTKCSTSSQVDDTDVQIEQSNVFSNEIETNRIKIPIDQASLEADSDISGPPTKVGLKEETKDNQN